MVPRGAALSAPRCTLIDVALVGLFVPMVRFLTHTPADPDLWGHLRFGSDLLATHRFPVHDPYSFTSDRAWINHEWLTEVVTAAFYRSAGAFGLNVLKLLVITAVAVMVWRRVTELGGRLFSAGLLTALALLTTSTRTQVVRPQLFSVLFFCVLLRTLTRIESGKREPWLLLPSLFCLWANMHGGWIVGFATFGLWTAFELAEDRPVQQRLRLGALLVASLAATLINPYGLGLWRFLRETVGLSRPDISEWRPFLALPRVIIGFELLLPVLALTAAVVRRQRPSWRHLAMLGLLGFATFRVSRVDAFLQLAVVFLSAPTTVGWLTALDDARVRRKSRLTRPSYVHSAVAAGLIVATTVLGATPINKIYIEGDWKPDADAARFVRQNAPHSRVLTWFDWGEYAIWHLSPAGIQVSMDGRRETVYSQRLLHEHFAFYDNEGDGWRYPARIGAERIWLPRHLAIVPVLKTHGWHVIYENSRSVVFAPDGEQLSAASAPASAPTSPSTSSSISASTSSMFFPGS